MEVKTRIRGRVVAPAGWLTRDQVAAMVGIHRQKVLQWEAAGKLPTGKMHGNVKVWRQAAIERFLVNLEVAPEDAA